MHAAVRVDTNRMLHSYASWMQPAPREGASLAPIQDVDRASRAMRPKPRSARMSAATDHPVSGWKQKARVQAVAA